MSSNKKAKTKSRKNPLRDMNPISQAQLMQNNIQEINDNLTETVEILNSIVGKLDLSNSPCEMAKFVTDKVCTLKYDFSSLSQFTQMFSIDKIKQLANKSLDISKNILENSTDPTNIGESLSNLVENTSNIAQNLPKMKGGSRNNAYRYITNPYTGRKVLLNGRIGKKIIKEYIKNNV